MANFCPNCGHPAAETDRFCVVCGHKLEGAQAEHVDIEKAKAETEAAARILCGGSLPDYLAAAQHIAEAEKSGAGAELMGLKEMVEHFKKLDSLRRVQSKFLPLGTPLPEGTKGMTEKEYIMQLEKQEHAAQHKAPVLPLRRDGQNAQGQQAPQQSSGPSFLKTAAAGMAGAAAGTMLANALTGSHGTVVTGAEQASQDPGYAAAPSTSDDTAQSDDYTGYEDTSADTDPGYEDTSADTDPGYEDTSADTDSGSDGGGFFDNLFGGGDDGGFFGGGGDDGGFFGGGGDDGGFFGGGDDGGWF